MEKSKIPDTTIETLTRNFFKESLEYGFKYEDYLKYVNILLEYAIDVKDNQYTKREINSEKLIKSDEENWELPIEAEEICIRNFEKNNDLILLEDWMQDKFGRYFLLSMTNSQDGIIEQLTSSKYNKLGIITLKDKTPIGVVAFLNIDTVHQKAELRKLIGVPEHRAHGYGKEATKYWIKYGFQKLKLKKIYLNTVDTNIHNIKINEELGFKVEGILRNETQVDGVVHDVLRMGLLNSD
ncbi:MAG: GNAT family N-acetyltransferase [Bacteroidetes bacterium]|nr:GNAT family N-acetyltransferase [Bacteroidota bacterium]MBU1116549.1 GNAT family N-acetyltransferase [Bacteroidota bacterium]MBU1797561.1 GNAT family N-acetyltransferase [Bacteroidota bacterium]